MDPGANRKAIAALAKELVVKRDAQACLDNHQSLPVYGQTVRKFQKRVADLWAEGVMSVPDSTMRFVLNAVTDTLPHNFTCGEYGHHQPASCVLSIRHFNMC